MIKKFNHKIINLIVMMIGFLLIFGSMNSVYATGATTPATSSATTGSSVYQWEPDYKAPNENEDVFDYDGESGTLWSRINTNKLFKEVRNNVAKWYYLFFIIGLFVMFVILIILAIRLALASLAPKKAMYKKMLVDWLVCMFLIFCTQFFMIGVIYFNEALLKIIRDVSQSINSDDGTHDLFMTVKTRAYDPSFMIGFPGMVLYLTLLWFTIKYIYIYAKRFLTITILTILAPVNMTIYSIQKIWTGKSKLLSKWIEEYAVNVLLQSIHALIYVLFVGTALKLTEVSLLGIILSFIFLNFMSKADNLFRTIFKFSDGSSLAEDISNSNLSDLKDKVTSAVGVGLALKDSSLGDAVGKGAVALAKLPAAGAIHAASFAKNNLGLGEFAANLNDKIDQYRMKKYDDQLDSVDGSIDGIKDGLSRKKVAELSKKRAKAQKDARKADAEMRRGNLSDAKKRKLALKKKDALKAVSRYTREIQETQNNYDNIENELKAFTDNPSMQVTEEFKEFKKAIEKTGDKKQRTLRRKQGYIARRGIFQRIANTLDPDNYMTFDTYKENGMIDGELHEKGEPIKEYEVYKENELDADGNIVHKKGEKKTDARGNFIVKGYKRKVIQSRLVYNAETDDFERIGGVREIFSKNAKEILGLTDDDKAVIKEVKQLIKDETLGFGAMIMGMGTFIDNPTLGLGLLAYGTKTYLKLRKDDSSIKEDFTMKRRIKKLRKDKKKVYKLLKYTTESKVYMDKIIQNLVRTDIDIGRIDYMFNLFESGDLAYNIPLLPFTLTGTRGIVKKNMGMLRKMVNQHKKDVENYRRTLLLSLMKSLADDVPESYKKLSQKVVEHAMNENIIGAMTNARRAAGTMFKVDDGTSTTEYYFDNPDDNDTASIRSRLLNALVKTAEAFNITNLSKIDLNNNGFKRVLRINLRAEGFRDDEINTYIYGSEKDSGVRHNLISEGIDRGQFRVPAKKIYKVIVQGTSGSPQEVEALDGVSFENLAKKIAGKTIITTYNGIKMNGRSYSNPDEMIAAYYDLLDNEIATKNSLSSSAFIVNSKKSNKTKVFVQPVIGVSIEDFAKELEGKQVVSKFNGFEIDTTQLKTAQEIIDAFNSAGITERTAVKFDTFEVESQAADGIKVKMNENADIEDFVREIGTSHIKTKFYDFDIDTDSFGTKGEIVTKFYDKMQSKYSEDKYVDGYFKKIGIAGLIEQLASTNPDIVNNRIFEQVVSEYMKANHISPSQINDPKVQKEIMKCFEKRLKKNYIKTSVISTVSEMKRDFSAVTSQDVLSATSEHNIEAYKTQIYAKLSTTLSENEKQQQFTEQMDETIKELGDMFDNIIIACLVNRKVKSTDQIDVYNASELSDIEIKNDILNMLKLEGVSNTDEELLTIIQNRLDSLTDEKIEETIIEQTIAEFVEKNCGGDYSKLNEDSISEQLQKEIVDKIESFDASATEEDKSKAGDVVEMMKDKKREGQTVEDSVDATNSIFSTVDPAEAAQDNNLNPNIPYPEVKTEVVGNDRILCTFSFPRGYENGYKMETCVKTPDHPEEKFVENIFMIALDNSQNIICARLSDGSEHGKTLIIRYPKEAMDVADRINKSKNQPNEDVSAKTKGVAQRVFDSLKEVKPGIAPSDYLGQENIDKMGEASVEQLFRNMNAQAGRNAINDVFEQMKTLEIENTNELGRDITSRVKASMESIYSAGMGLKHERLYNDELESASNELLTRLLEMRIVEQDAISCKMKKEYKKNKKFKTKRLNIDDKIEKMYKMSIEDFMKL